MGRKDEAHAAFEAATCGISEPASAMYYNDQPPESIYFQGLAWRKLGEEKKAATIFQKLVDYGINHLDDEVSMDYFAVSLPDFPVFDVDLTVRNRRHCLFMQALGFTGLGEVHAAKNALASLLVGAPDHAATALFEGDV